MSNTILVVVLLAILAAVIFFLQKNKSAEKKYHNIDEAYNAKRNAEQADIDAILDKINKRGIDSLSIEERRKLDDFAKRQG